MWSKLQLAVNMISFYVNQLWTYHDG